MNASKPNINCAEVPLSESVHQHQRLYRHYASVLSHYAASSSSALLSTASGPAASPLAAVSNKSSSPVEPTTTPTTTSNVTLLTSLPPGLAQAPTLTELRRLHAEMEALRNAALAREHLVQRNLDLATAWINRSDKGGSPQPVLSNPAAASSPALTSPAAGPGGATLAAVAAATLATDPTAALPSTPAPAHSVGRGPRATFATTPTGASVAALNAPPLFPPPLTPRPDLHTSLTPPVDSAATSPKMAAEPCTVVSLATATAAAAGGAGGRKMSKSRAPRVEENGIVKVERVDENSRPVSPNQLKRKRDELEVEGEGEGLAAVRKSEDGSVKIALTQNGIMKVKMSSASSSSPPFTQAVTPVPSLAKSHSKPANARPPRSVPKPKSNRRRGTNASELVEDPSALRNETPEPEKKDEAPVNGDYSKAKAPPQQIPVAQFWSFCESQYFRPLTDEDFAFLDSNGDDVTPFIAPPLGRHYLEQWADEDGALFERPPLLLHSEPNRRHASTSTAYPAATLFASRPEYDDSHSTFISLTGGGRAGCREGGGSSLGDLGQRIIDLVREQDITVPGLDLDSCQKQWNEAAPEEEEALEEENDIAAFRHGTSSDYYGHDGYENGSRTARASMPNGKSGEFVHLEPTPAAAAGRPYTEFLPLEDRLLNELKHIGVIDGTKIAMDHKDNDEISQELRRVQHDLLQQMLDNQAKKQRLKELAAYHRGYEQYCSVLDALSKQIEAGYAKRAKTQPKPKKKGGKGGGGGGTAASAGPSLTNSVMAVTTSASTTFTANIAAAPTTITATANSISSSSPSSSSASPFHIINGNSIISNGNTSNTSSSTTSATAASSLSTISSNNAPVSLSLSPTTAPLRQPHSSSSSSLSTLSLASATSLPFASAATSASASSSSTSSTSSTPAPAPAPAPAAATVAGAAAATNTAARSPGVSQQILELIERRAFVIESVGCLFPPEKVSIPTESVFATRVEG